MRTKKRPAAFRQGRFGACGARLYEFRGRSDSSSSEEERIGRFAADSIYEGLVYLGNSLRLSSTLRNFSRVIAFLLLLEVFLQERARRSRLLYL